MRPKPRLVKRPDAGRKENETVILLPCYPGQSGRHQCECNSPWLLAIMTLEYEAGKGPDLRTILSEVTHEQLAAVKAGARASSKYIPESSYHFQGQRTNDRFPVSKPPHQTRVTRHLPIVMRLRVPSNHCQLFPMSMMMMMSLSIWSISRVSLRCVSQFQIGYDITYHTASS